MEAVCLCMTPVAAWSVVYHYFLVILSRNVCFVWCIFDLMTVLVTFHYVWFPWTVHGFGRSISRKRGGKRRERVVSANSKRILYNSTESLTFRQGQVKSSKKNLAQCREFFGISCMHVQQFYRNVQYSKKIPRFSPNSRPRSHNSFS